LLSVCWQYDICFDWQAGRCRIRLWDDWEELADLPIRKSIFRAVLARIAALCNSQVPNSASPYGGQGELPVGQSSTAMMRVTFVNTVAEQRLVLAPIGGGASPRPESGGTRESAGNTPDAGAFLVPRRVVTAGEVEAWLTERISARMRIPRSRVHGATPFVEFGMSSVDALAIAGDLERWLGRPLSPTAIYNYPTISTLARWLAPPSGDESSPDRRSPVLAREECAEGHLPSQGQTGLPAK